MSASLKGRDWFSLQGSTFLSLPTTGCYLIADVVGLTALDNHEILFKHFLHMPRAQRYYSLLDRVKFV